MLEREIKFTLVVFDSINQLEDTDRQLLLSARQALQTSYSPYSNFKVGAAALLSNGKTVTGANQENASFPAGICAEGTVLSAAAAQYPGVAIQKLAITVHSSRYVVEKPVAPCGICRQQLLEHEQRFNQPIYLLLSGQQGPVYAVATVKHLLPLYFSQSDM